MNMLWSWIDTNALSLSVIEVLIKLTVVLGTVMLLSIWKNYPAATKRLFWSAAIVIALLLPLGSGLLPTIAIPLPNALSTNITASNITSPKTASPNTTTTSIQTAAQAPVNDALLTAQSTSTKTSMPQAAKTNQQISPPSPGLSLQTVAGFMALLWAVGFLFFNAKLWRQHQHVQSIKHNANRFDDDKLKAIASLATLGKQVPVLVSEEIATPIALGIFKPVIIVPAMAAQWDKEKLQSAMTHELAHVRGRDNLLRCCASILCALYWFHPLVWYSARKLHEEQEKSADNAVINQGISPSSYAQNLLDIVKSLQGHSHDATLSASMASYSFFPQRMRSLLAESQNRQGLSLGKTVVMVTLLCLFAVPITLLTTQATNAQDSSQASQQVNEKEQTAPAIDIAQKAVADEKPTAKPKPTLTPIPVNQSADMALFQKLDSQMTIAINKQDVDTLVNFYTDEAQIKIKGNRGHNYHRGKSDIKKYWTDLVDSELSIRSEVQSVNRNGDKAQVSSRYWASFDTDIGKLDDFFGGLATTDWQLIDGQWRIVNDIVHDPDYVNDESINRIVDTAMSAMGDVDWEEFGKTMASMGQDIAKEFVDGFSKHDWQGDWPGGSKQRNNPLLNAIESGNSKSVKLLLENGADANVTSGWNRSALYLASEQGNEDMVEQLLKHKADPNTATSQYEKTPLYVAAENGHFNVVKLLVKGKADLNKKSRYGRTPLSVASAEGHDKIVEYLLKQGADVNI